MFALRGELLVEEMRREGSWGQQHHPGGTRWEIWGRGRIRSREECLEKRKAAALSIFEGGRGKFY